METVLPKFGSLSEIARRLAVPNDSRPGRLPTFPNLERTAVLSFTDTGTTFVTGATRKRAMVFRDPAYPLWTQQTLPAFRFSLRAVDSTNVNVPANESTVLATAGVPFFERTFGNSAFTNWPLLRVDGKDFYLFGFNDGLYTRLNGAVMITGTTLTNLMDMGITMELLKATGEVVTVEVDGALGGNYFNAATRSSILIDSSLYSDAVGFRPISVRVQSSAATSCTITAVTSGLTTALVADIVTSADPFELSAIPARTYELFAPFALVPDLNVSQVWSSVRCTAAAVLFKNVTAVLNKEGTINAARIAVASNALWPASWNSFADVHPRDRYFGALEKGLYTYTLPDAGSELFRRVSSDEDEYLTYMDFSNIHYVNCIEFDDISSGSGTTLAVSLDRHVEFRTTSRLFPTDFARTPLEQYHGAQMALNQMGIFFENPLHLSSIARMAQNAAKALWPVVRPYAIPAARATAAWATKKIAGSFKQAGFTSPAPSKPKADKKKRKVIKRKK